MRMPINSLLLLGFFILGNTGCQNSGGGEVKAKPFSEKVFWEGVGPMFYSVDSTEFPGENIDSSFYSSVIYNHHFTFFGPDTIRLELHEFKFESLAFAAFLERAKPLEIAEFCYRNRNNLVFVHGRYIGEIKYAMAGLIPVHFLKANLKIDDEEIFKIPSEFLAFPMIGRIPKSERVILSHFMGKKWAFPVFSIRYHCHNDSGTAFRTESQSDSSQSWMRQWFGKTDTLDWGREFHFQGQNEIDEPLVFWSYPQGELGVLGCYDLEMARSYAEKMKKMTVLLEKP